MIGRGMILLDLNNLFGITQCDNWKNGQLLCERTWPLVFYQFPNKNLELANNNP